MQNARAYDDDEAVRGWPEGGEGGKVSVRSCVTSGSVARVRGPFADCVLRAVFNERAKSLSLSLAPACRGASIIIGREEIKRSLRRANRYARRGEARSQRLVFLKIHPARCREINNYRGGREC